MNTEQSGSPQTPARSGALWALGVFAVLFVLFFFRAVPLTLDPLRATNGADQFDAVRAIDRLGKVLDGTPHPVDSAPLDGVRSRLLQEIVTLGYQPQVKATNTCRGSISGSSIRCALVQNIYFTAGPKTGPALVLTAHYDSVPASPGFGDDGVGVAVWLEVAKLLKEHPPEKPVMFLITDGEETALLGAQAFVNAKADYGVEVGRIINLEARGVRGPAMMFETGHPNAGIVSDWAKNGARPFSNSMMTAVYELLPNSTDLTVHLRDGSTGINIAIADGLDFYHTNQDDLAHLDRASVQHMGDQALGAARAFLAADWGVDKDGGEIAYSDVASRVFVQLPEVFTLVLLGLCFGVSAMLMVRPTRAGGWQKLDWRAFVLPPVLAIAGGLIAFLAQFGISFLRPEPTFWTAYPQALNMTIFAGVVLVGGLALTFLAPNAKREALFASGWFWFLIVGMGLSFAKAGFSMMYLIPGVVFVVAAAIGWLAPRFQLIAYSVAGAMLVLIFFPLLHLLDVMMGLGMAAMFGVVEAMVLAPLLAIVGGLRHGKGLVLGALGVAFAAGLVATAVVPAYSVERPLPLNFTAHYDMDESKGALFAGARAGALPKAVKDQLKVGEIASPPGAAANLAAKPISFAPPAPATATVVSDTATADGKRSLKLQLAAPGARVVRLRIPAEAHPTQLSYGDKPIAMREPQNGYYIVEIVGRAADGATLDLTLEPSKDASAKKPSWIVQGIWTQLPPDAKPLTDARPDTAVRIQDGDVTVTTRKQQF
ncbi:MAG: M28 family peptidase [Hyphomonadaceae bacterium]